MTEQAKEPVHLDGLFGFPSSETHLGVIVKVVSQSTYVSALNKILVTSKL